MNRYSLAPNAPRVAVATLLLLALLPGTASAHKVGESYLFLKTYQKRIEGWVEATLEDLDKVLDLDVDGDGKVSDAELAARKNAVSRYASEHLAIRFGETPCKIQYGEVTAQSVQIARYARVAFTIEDAGPVPESIDIDYSLLFDRDPGHRALVIVEYNERTQETNLVEAFSLVFSTDNRSQTLALTKISRWSSFVLFVKEGVHHIWIGWDHILFLLVLLLPAVLVRRNGSWQPVDRFPPALWSVVRIVTVFTIAHSVTLSLAVLKVVTLGPRLVESVIAASVVVAAVNNVVPFLRQGVVFVIFAFGLFHGFGFASQLEEMIRDRSSLAMPLLGFNIGVELGQLAIVVVVSPILFATRRLSLYVPAILRAGSILAAIVAAIWLAERAFEISIITAE